MERREVSRSGSGPPLVRDDRLARLRRLSYWLDEGIRLPGTRIRIGLDPILGLVPGVGDAAGALMAVALLVEAARRGVSRYTLMQITANIVLDAVLGSVPIAGDLFDAAWKANVRNLALLERHAAAPAVSEKASRKLVFLLGGLAIVVVSAVVVGGVLLTVQLLRGLTAASP